MAPLPPDLRKSLDKSVVKARDRAEEACRAALNALGVDAREAPPALSAEDRQLRNALRAKQRQLGGEFEQLVTECAYEQWHVMLFARFLAENDLLMHQSGAHVTLDEVAELAREEGEGDPWLLAARYAAAMLPGIFKPADPCVRLALAPERRKALEDILSALPTDVFTADDAFGWVYQFWQTKKKKEVNASERKIGGADLAPVTQLFTEDYMVRFLLENSLGAWWAARHPESPLLASFDYLRFTDDGQPAAGRFEGWPDSVAEVTMMDLCCGSGHFLIAAFGMLRKMREEEEGLSVRDAVDAVLRDNLFGLELDARCVQLAAFALALAAWKVAGYHELPALNLACSGIPARGSLDQWTKLAKGDERLERVLASLHELFREADSLGSLIDPRRAVEDGSLLSAPFEEVAPLLERALASDPDPVAAVFGESACEVARAASLLAGSYVLTVTNPPYLGSGSQEVVLRQHSDTSARDASSDLATTMVLRMDEMTRRGGSVVCVVPQHWLFQSTYESFRTDLLRNRSFHLVITLGPHAFEAIGGEIVQVVLLAFSKGAPGAEWQFMSILGIRPCSTREKDWALMQRDVVLVLQASQLANPAARLTMADAGAAQLLRERAQSFQGISTGDVMRFSLLFWETGPALADWEVWLGPADVTAAWAGRFKGIQTASLPIMAEQGAVRGAAAWGRPGVAICQMGTMSATLYSGERFDTNVAVLVPRDPRDLPALWAYAVSGELVSQVRLLDAAIKVTTSTFEEVPFDLAHWTNVAEEQYPNGLPEPNSDDPTQWLFKGNVIDSEQPLHVALARLLGYRWPDQEPDELDRFADDDGIVCLPPVAGERPAHERLRELIAAAYSPRSPPDEVFAPEGSRNLEDWLREKAFASHGKLFHTRPFIWHVWDGRKDGFAALVNYHKLDEATLQKLTYTSLGWWIDRQRADAAQEVAGAEARLAAATELQSKLRLILEGESPYDIFVRWKPLAEQPLGWQPDLNDGVRLNIRPFVTAGVLRAKLSISWNKDRGKNPDGSERQNDLHTTLAEKRAAREESRSCE